MQLVVEELYYLIHKSLHDLSLPPITILTHCQLCIFIILLFMYTNYYDAQNMLLDAHCNKLKFSLCVYQFESICGHPWVNVQLF